MSLSNPFTSEPSSHFVPVSQEPAESKHDANGEDGTNFAIARTIKRMRTVEKTAADENLESKRPPYVHVSHAEPILNFDMLTLLTVDACGRAWGYKR